MEQHIHPEPKAFIWKYVFTVDHKIIARQFLWTGLMFLALGGTLAMMIRWQWAYPKTAVPVVGQLFLSQTGGAITPPTYTSIFTMHGLIMIFWAITPILIGASKTQPVAVLEEAIRAGLVDFGENKVQEAQSKWPALKAAHPRVRLHLIGPLQSNKAEDAVALFEVIHTVDRMKIADALAQACKKLDKAPVFLVQVNTGEEPQKAGVAPCDLAVLLTHCHAIGLPISGLMCVPPENENPAPHFALLKKMADMLELRELSMGMSGDFETALRLGSTMVRVGTALFGQRR